MNTAEETKPVKQAFGSPGGKSYLAPRIVDMMPKHRVYVEPFAGGAAVYFKKSPSEKEILNDKDVGIAFAFQFLRDITPQQFGKLKKMNWMGSEEQFKRVQAMKPRSKLDKFYKWYYLRTTSFGSGATTFNPATIGRTKDIDRLWRIHERLKKTKIHARDALSLIDRYDSPDTLFYLDPPYPDRGFIGSTFGKYTEEDLSKLVNKLKGIKGKFVLSLGTEHLKLLPSNWHYKRLKVWRNVLGDEQHKLYGYEIVAGNYPLDGSQPVGALSLARHKPSPIPRETKRLKRHTHKFRHKTRRPSALTQVRR